MAASVEPFSEKLYGEDTLAFIQVHEFDIPLRQLFHTTLFHPPLCISATIVVILVVVREL